MKKSSASQKTLSAIREALRRGIPLSGAVVAAACLTGAAPGQAPAKAGNQLKEASKSSVEESEKTVFIDTMSLSYRWCTTAGIVYPAPMEIRVKSYTVKAGDTWENLAKQHRTTVEIMMRINGVSAETVYGVFKTKKIPEKLKLRPGQRIHVPLPGQESLAQYERERKVWERLTAEMDRRFEERRKKSGGSSSPASAEKPKK